MNVFLTPVQKLYTRIPVFLSLIADVLAISITLYTILTIRSLIASIVMLACLLLYFWLLLRSPTPDSSSLTWRTRLGQTDITLFIYAVLASIIIVTIRAGSGFMDVPSMGGLSNERIAAIHLNEGWSIYDKSHVRLGSIEFWFYFGSVLLISLMAIRYWGRRWPQVLKLHPATALFAISLFFGTVILPPYYIQWIHWSSFLGPALDVANGNWPILHIQNGYGFLYAGIVAAWIKLFPVNELSLAALIILFAIIAHIVAYILIKRLSRSPWFALLLSNILIFGLGSIEDQIKTGVQSPVRWHFILTVSMFLTWVTLSKMGARSVLAALLLGPIFLWNPLMTIFPVVAFVGVHLYRFLLSKDRQTLFPLGGLLVGTLVPVGLVLIFSNGWPDDGFMGIVGRVTNIALFFGGGFGNFPQLSFWTDILSITAVIIALYLLFRRTQKRTIVLCRDDLFLICCLATLAFPIGYAMGRNVGFGLWMVTWVMMLPIALFVGKLWRLVRIYRLPAWPFAVVITLILLNVNIIGLAHQHINDFLNGYEEARWAWSVDCAGLIQQGLKCDFIERPGLRKAIAEARKPPLIALANGETNTVLLAACQNGWAIVSTIDTYIYLQGDCKTQLPSSALLDTTYADIDSPGWVPAILQQEVVLVDERTNLHGAYSRFVNLLEQRLKEAGYSRRIISQTGVSAFVRSPIRTSKVEEMGESSE